MSGLPPPPSDLPPGSGPGLPPTPGPLIPGSFPGVPIEPSLPRWRRASVGWVLLHIAIGFALWFGLLLVATLVALIAGHVADATIESDEAIGSWSALVLLGAMAGWMLFVYLRTSLLVRWLVFAVVAGVPTVGTIVVLMDRLPSA